MAALFQPMDPPYRRTDVFVISSIVYQENPIGIESILTISVEPSSNAKGVIYVPRNSLKDGMAGVSGQPVWSSFLGI